jgi:hypothetical protein
MIYNNGLIYLTGGALPGDLYVASGLAANTTCSISLVLTVDAMGAVSRARVLLDGVEKIDHSLTTEESASVAPGPWYPFLEDGVLFSAVSGNVTSFIVRPCSG